MVDPTSDELRGTNLEAIAENGKVQLAPADPSKLSQRWVFRAQDDQTVIQNMKYLNFVLTGNGVDTAVTLVPDNADGNTAQQWTLYSKDKSARARSASQRSVKATPVPG
jgi:hypothetical protein